MLRKLQENANNDMKSEKIKQEQLRTYRNTVKQKQKNCTEKISEETGLAELSGGRKKQ